MDTENCRVTSIRNCIQAKFYGVYTLLKLRASKTYGSTLEDLLANRPLEVVTIIENLIGDRKTSMLVLKECLKEECTKENLVLAQSVDEPLISQIHEIHPSPHHMSTWFIAGSSTFHKFSF